MAEPVVLPRIVKRIVSAGSCQYTSLAFTFCIYLNFK